MPNGVDWALTRAFGPIELEASECTQDERLSAAQRLGLMTRIGARHSSSRLAVELGEKAAQRLQVTLRTQMAKGLLLQNVQRQIENLAESQQLRLVPLKFAALVAKGYASPTTRAACDLDMLVAESDVSRLADAMGTIGFRRVGIESVQHQPFVLTRDDGAYVELHIGIPHLQESRNARFATLEELIERSLVLPNQSNSGYVYLPTDALLFAHLIAHGVVQHGLEPKTYPSLRLMADLVDLSPPRFTELLPEIARLIGNVVSPDELSGLRLLADALRSSSHPFLFQQDTPEGLLLRHFVWVCLDERYRAEAMLYRLLQSAREDGVLALTRQLFRFAFALPDEHLSKLYPETTSPLVRRIARPFDFALRGFRRVLRSLH
jgi:hypothetical protein